LEGAGVCLSKCEGPIFHMPFMCAIANKTILPA
jgi:hypothetical protein